MASRVIIDGTFSPAVQPAFVMSPPRKREIEHTIQDGGIVTDLIAVKDKFLLQFNHLTQDELNSLMIIYSQLGVNSIHTLEYDTTLIKRIWDGTTSPSPFVPSTPGSPAIGPEQPVQSLSSGSFSTLGFVAETGFKFSVTTNGTITKLFGNFGGGGATFNLRLWRVSDTSLIAGPVPVTSNGVWVGASIGPVSVVTTEQYIVSVGVTDGSKGRIYTPTGFSYPSTVNHVNLLSIRRNGTVGNFPTIETTILPYIEGAVDVEWFVPAVAPTPAIPGVNNDVNRIRKKVKFDVFDPPHKENVPNEYTVTLECKEI